MRKAKHALYSVIQVVTIITLWALLMAQMFDLTEVTLTKIGIATAICFFCEWRIKNIKL